MINFAKKVGVAAVLAASAFAAHAAPGPITFDATGTAAFSNSFGSTSKGSFTDLFTFNLSSLSNVSGSVVSVANFSASFKVIQDLAITGLYIVGASGSPIYGSSVSGAEGFADVWTLAAQNLSAGTYTLGVVGAVKDVTGGTYAGTLNVSPVPEPATWGMMLGGLGLVGVLAKRRKAKAGEQKVSYAQVVAA